MDKGVKTKTVETVHCVIHPALDMAVRDDIIRHNPSDGVIAEMKKSVVELQRKTEQLPLNSRMN